MLSMEQTLLFMGAFRGSLRFKDYQMRGRAGGFHGRGYPLALPG